jgi:hypothetical protein
MTSFHASVPGSERGGCPVIRYVYEIDYPLGEERKYLDWVRSIADTLQAPGGLRGLASYDVTR